MAVCKTGVMAGPTNTQFAVAVHVLTYLASFTDRGPIGATELAASTNVNPVHIRRVLGPLREAGVVRSTPGAKGGWELARSAADVTLADVWRLVQGPDRVIGLHHPSPDCPVGWQINVELTEVDRRVAAAVEAELGTRTVADLLAGVSLT